MPNNERSEYKYSIIIALLLYMILYTGIVAGQNLITFFGITITTGMLIFPFTYILIAISTELYGTRKTREIIFCSAFCNILMIFIIFIFSKIPSERAYIGDPAIYHNFTSRLSYLMLVSTVAFLVSENANVWIISKLRALTNNGNLLTRAFLSTASAIIIDTWLVFPLFLSRQNDLGLAVWETLIVMCIKLGYDIVLLPIFCVIIEMIKYQHGDREDCLPGYAKAFTSSSYLGGNDMRKLIE